MEKLRTDYQNGQKLYEDDLNLITQSINELQDSLSYVSPKVDFIVETTWSELKAIRDNGELVPGQKYRITDYVTQVTLEEEYCISTEEPFDLIVTALDVNKLSEIGVQAIQHRAQAKYINVNYFISEYKNDKEDMTFVCKRWPEMDEEPLFCFFKRTPNDDKTVEGRKKFAWTLLSNSEDYSRFDILDESIDWENIGVDVYYTETLDFTEGEIIRFNLSEFDSVDTSYVVGYRNDDVCGIKMLMSEIFAWCVVESQNPLLDIESYVPGEDGDFKLYSFKETVSNGDIISYSTKSRDYDTVVVDCGTRLRIPEYFDNSKLEGWSLKYCLDNDTTRFDWARERIEEPLVESRNRYIVGGLLDNGKTATLGNWVLIQNENYDGSSNTRWLYHDLGDSDMIAMFRAEEAIADDEQWSEYVQSVEWDETTNDIWLNKITDQLNARESFELNERLQCNDNVNGGYDRFYFNTVGSTATGEIIVHPEGKGVIYYMEDENGYSANFDFKNIKIFDGRAAYMYLYDNNGADGTMITEKSMSINTESEPHILSPK